MIEPNRGPWGGIPTQLQPLPVPDVPLFLWRGDRLIGALAVRRDVAPAQAAESRARGELHAVLLSDLLGRFDAAVEALASVWQRPRPFGPPGALVQRPRTSWDMATRTRDTSAARATAAEPLADVRPSDAYVIRDASHKLLAFQTISILEVKLVPGTEVETLKTLPRVAVRNGSVWIVSAFP